jgi:hypothetical protein
VLTIPSLGGYLITLLSFFIEDKVSTLNITC